jgi:hypothetical protein
LAEARQSLERLLELLVAWLADRDAVSRKLARTDWLMDGWERIVRLWGQAEKVRERRDALDEIIPMLPIIPREAGAWVGFHIAMEPPLRTHRVVGGLQDWRTGTCLQDMIHRNEGLIAA